MGYPVHSYGTGEMISAMNRREDKDERHTNELITAIREQANAGTASENSFGIVAEKLGSEVAQGYQNVNTQAKEDNKLKRENMLFDKRLTASKLAGSYVDQGYKFLEMGEKELAQQAFNMAQPVYDKLGQNVKLSSLVDEKTTRETIKKANLSSLTGAIQNIKTTQDVQNANILLQNYKAANKADDVSVIEKMVSNANARLIAKAKVRGESKPTSVKEYEYGKDNPEFNKQQQDKDAISNAMRDPGWEWADEKEQLELVRKHRRILKGESEKPAEQGDSKISKILESQGYEATPENIAKFKKNNPGL